MERPGGTCRDLQVLHETRRDPQFIDLPLVQPKRPARGNSTRPQGSIEHEYKVDLSERDWSEGSMEWLLLKFL